MKFIKKWWFYMLVPILILSAIMAVPGPKDLVPYEDYIFYGIAQNKVTSKNLKVNFSIKGFPYKRHSMYVEIIKPNGEIDFLYSEEHTKNHKAHYHPKAGLRKYIANYKIPSNLPAGKYKLRVRFEFDTDGWGRLKRDVIISNDVIFEIK